MPPPLVLGAGGPRLHRAAVGALLHSGCDCCILLLLALLLLLSLHLALLPLPRLHLRLPLLALYGFVHLSVARMAQPLLPGGGMAVPKARHAAFAGAAALQALPLRGLLLRILLFLWLNFALHLLPWVLLRLPLLPLEGCPRFVEAGMAQPLLPGGGVAVPGCRLGAAFAGAAAPQALTLRLELWLLLLLTLLLLRLYIRQLWQLATMPVSIKAAGPTQLLAGGRMPLPAIPTASRARLQGAAVGALLDSDSCSLSLLLLLLRSLLHRLRSPLHSWLLLNQVLFTLLCPAVAARLPCSKKAGALQPKVN